MDSRTVEEKIRLGRAFVRGLYNTPEYEDWETDQEKKLPQPPLVKAAVSEEVISLPADFSGIETVTDFLSVVNRRASHRVYTDEAVTLKQLSYLLWCTQGVKDVRGKAYATLRTVPCGGARHEFETYLAVRRAEGLEPGFYHYLPMSHALERLGAPEDMEGFISASLCEQRWAVKASVVFYYSIVPYRAEWRYSLWAHRITLVDAGHITQNLYLASTALGLGSCEIGAVDGPLADKAFGLDGEEEFVFLAHPVGTVSEKDGQKEQDFYAFVREEGL